MRGRVAFAVVLAGLTLFESKGSAQAPKAAQPQTSTAASPAPAPVQEPSEKSKSDVRKQPTSEQEGCERTADATESAAFDEKLALSEKATEMLRRLEAERAQQFAESAERYARLREFTRALQAQHELEQQQEFADRFALYVRSRAFVKRLIEQRRRDAAPATAAPRGHDTDSAVPR